MGGNALNKFGIETDRISRSQYLEILSFVKSIFPEGLEILSYREKKDFGDLDYLLPLQNRESLIKKIQDNFNPRKIFVNDNTYSFDYNNFQIDLICKKPEDLQIAQAYLSWNDMGNLLGRIYHKMGLSFGHTGLVYKVRQSLFGDVNNKSDHVIKEIVLSKDIKEILRFAGYSYERWAQGFDSLEDIFFYVASTHYFNSLVFSFDNLNHTNRTRNRKRPTYCSFIEWVESHPELDKKFDFGTKESWIEKIHLTFPIKHVILECKNSYFKMRQLHEKFNGSLVQKWTGLSGAELGKCLASFKFYINKVVYYAMDLDFDTFLERHSERLIEKTFKEWYAQQGKI